MNTIKTFGLYVFSDSLSKILLKPGCTSLLSTISPNSYGLLTKDPLFREALIKSDYLVLDGVYFALSSILLQGKNIQRNQGPDVFYHFMERINQQSGKIFFLGASKQTLDKIKIRASKEFPNVSTNYYSPPYKPEFNEEDNNMMIQSVNSFKPDVLFIGMTCPKQEKWAYQNKSRIYAKLIICIGGVFDWYAGNQPEIGQIWWKLRLGWVKRIIDRPEVLKRNIPNVMIFLKHLFLAIIGIKKYKNGTF
jgi:N-acetylglucosaminyldiphosphoundecaprenol N-acetyl-beta-D-mannosaminyltransferase